MLIAVNLLSGKAGKWLTADRDKLANSAKKEFRELVLAALEMLVKEDLTNLPINQKLKPTFSLFLESMAVEYGGTWRDFADKLEGAWLDLNIPDEERTFRELFESSEWRLKIKPFDDRLPGNYDLIIIPHIFGYFVESIVINEWLKHENRTVQITEDNNDAILNSSLQYQFKKEPQPSYSQGALAIRLAEVAQNVHYNQRFLLDFPDDDWSVIHLKKGTKLRAYDLFNRQPQQIKKFVLLPFLFCAKSVSGIDSKVAITPAQLDALCKWIQPHLEIPASVDDIKKVYDKLIDHIDNEIMRRSPHWEVWSKARGID